jgi:phenylalanyl-tRNA synthetase alpha chain
VSNLSSPWSDYLAKIEACADDASLSAIEHELFGRKAGALTLAMNALSSLSIDEKREQGKTLNVAKRALEDAIAARRSALQGNAFGTLATDDALDVTLELPAAERGHLHPIHEFIRKAEEVFGRMGFDAAVGPEIDDEDHQFDLLNFPPDHAARDAQDIFYLNLPSAPNNRLLLRGHTSTVQIRYMRDHKPPFRMICAGKVYRKDDDATHSPMFHQVEGLMIGKDVTLANMKEVLHGLAASRKEMLVQRVHGGSWLELPSENAACIPRIRHLRQVGHVPHDHLHVLPQDTFPLVQLEHLIS